MKRWTNDKKPKLAKLWEYCETPKHKKCAKESKCENVDAIGFAYPKKAENDFSKCRQVEGKIKITGG